VRVVVGKIEGVRSVKVSLKDGVATIQFAPVNRVTVARIREAIRGNGFMARDAEVRVAGSLVQRGDTPTLVIPETGEAFLLEEAPGAPGVLRALRRQDPRQRVELAGRIPGPKGRNDRGPLRLVVRSYSAA